MMRPWLLVVAATPAFSKGNQTYSYQVLIDMQK